MKQVSPLAEQRASRRTNVMSLYSNTANGLVTNSALILQTKVFSIKRLMNKTGIVDKDNFNLILEKGKSLFSPTS